MFGITNDELQDADAYTEELRRMLLEADEMLDRMVIMGFLYQAKCLSVRLGHLGILKVLHDLGHRDSNSLSVKEVTSLIELRQNLFVNHGIIKTSLKGLSDVGVVER